MGISLLKDFRVLLTLTQQHRGLTNGYLCGDASLIQKIAPIQKQLKRRYEVIEYQAPWLTEQQSWQALKQDWLEVYREFKSRSAVNNLSAHSHVIANILYVIDDCAESCQLYELKDQQDRSIRYLWQDILVAAEDIGQARAIGTGVAAAQNCCSVDRIRLKYLQQAIRRTARNQVGSIQDDSGYAAIGALLETIDKQVLVDCPKISPTEYFNQATLALEEVLDVFDRQLENINKA